MHRHKSFGCRQYYSDNGICQLAAYFVTRCNAPKRLPNSGNNLRPAETHDQLEMPFGSIFGVFRLLGAGRKRLSPRYRLYLRTSGV